MKSQNRIVIVFLITALCLMLSAVGVVAQEATPVPPDDPAAQETTAETGMLGDARVVGDPANENLQVVQSYLETRDPALLAENAQFFDHTRLDPVVGRDQIFQAQDEFYNVSFTNALTHPSLFVVAEDVVVAEFQFTGTNTGLYREFPATGLEVAVPMVGIFEVQNGQIQSLRLYYDEAGIHHQLGYGPGFGVWPGPGMTDPAVHPGVGAQAMRNVIENPAAYFDQTVTVEGFVGDMVGERAFLLHEDGFLGNESILVLDGTQDGLQFIPLTDARARVTGTIRQYETIDFPAEFGPEFDENLFAQYQGWPVLVATSAVNLDDVATMGTIAEEPSAFYGQAVRIEGLVGEVISDNSFILREDAFLGGLFGRNEMLVVDSTDDGLDFIPLTDSRVRVVGTVREFTRAEFETELGLPFDDERYVVHEGQAVIFATSVINLDDVITMSNITDEPEAFEGQTVSIEGRVGDLVGANAFELREDAFLGGLFGENRILVVNRTETGLDFAQMQDSWVRVTGTVHTFVHANIEQEYGLALTDERFRDYEGQPVIVAEEVVVLE